MNADLREVWKRLAEDAMRSQWAGRWCYNRDAELWPSAMQGCKL